MPWFFDYNTLHTRSEPDVVDEDVSCYNNHMLTEFIAKKLKAAKYKLLEDGTFFGEIPGFNGVWANAKDLEDCREELREVLEDWIVLKIKDNEPIPGFRIKTDRRSLVKDA